MKKTEELAQAISDCVEIDITTGQRTINSSAVPYMIDQLNQNGWLESELKKMMIVKFNQDDPDTHPKCYPSFDWAGKDTLVSQVYITNVGAGQFVNNRWVTVSYDASDTNKGLPGVTHYLNHKEVMG